MTLTAFQAANPYDRVVVDQYGNTAADLARTGGRRTDQPGNQYYTVKQGDSPASIAGNIYGDQRMFADILAYNGNSPLHPGMRIYLPPKRNNPGVSDLTAAGWGMATSKQIATAYTNKDLDVNGKMNWTPFVRGQTGVTQGETNRQAAYDVSTGKYKTLDEALAAQTGAGTSVNGAKAPTNPLLNNANPYKNAQKFRNADAASMATIGNNTGINAKVSRLENAQGVANQTAYNQAQYAAKGQPRISNNPGVQPTSTVAPIKTQSNLVPPTYGPPPPANTIGPTPINTRAQSYARSHPDLTNAAPSTPGVPVGIQQLGQFLGIGGGSNTPVVSPSAGRLSAPPTGTLRDSTIASMVNPADISDVVNQYSGITSGGNTAAAASPAALVAPNATYGAAANADVQSKVAALASGDPSQAQKITVLTPSDINYMVQTGLAKDATSLLTTFAANGQSYALSPKTGNYELQSPLAQASAYTVPDDWWPGMLGLNENIRYYQQGNTYTGRTITTNNRKDNSANVPYAGTINFTG
jgi:hypothetical protein